LLRKWKLEKMDLLLGKEGISPPLIDRFYAYFKNRRKNIDEKRKEKSHELRLTKGEREGSQRDCRSQ